MSAFKVSRSIRRLAAAAAFSAGVEIMRDFFLDPGLLVLVVVNLRDLLRRRCKNPDFLLSVIGATSSSKR